jgi:hypothetical protein
VRLYSPETETPARGRVSDRALVNLGFMRGLFGTRNHSCALQPFDVLRHLREFLLELRKLV